jgi:hypothetical protein
MTPLFKKLNFKSHNEIAVFNYPASFETELIQMKHEAAILTDVAKIETGDFMIVFATTQAEVDAWAKRLAPKMAHDGLLWFCYPKGTSKKYTCDFNRDTGWQILGELGLEPVRQVAIDEDWSALRFRRPEHIKIMTRSFAITDLGKQKASKSKP